MEQQRRWEEKFLKKVYEKLKVVVDEVEMLNPYSTVDGKYDNMPMPPYSWTCGFWGGIQWLLYQISGEVKFLEKAKVCSKRMDAGLAAFTPLGHDVGFQYLLTTVPDYRITGREGALVSSVHAATLLAGRYNLEGGYIRAWNDGTGIDPSARKDGYAIIDCMMNLPLLFWASEETGDPRYKQIAMSHADTVMREFIRDDGSVEHIVVFNAEDGSVKEKPRGQGYDVGTAWTRGQGWAVYGFAMAYRYTGKQAYLETALKVARYFLEHLPENGVPPCDFKQPVEPAFVDASAGVIVACGLTELQNRAKDTDRIWLEEGICKLLNGAYSNCNFSLDNQGVLQNCLQQYHGDQNQISMVYADFYLLEVLLMRHGAEPLF